MGEYEMPETGRILVKPEFLSQKALELSQGCERLRAVLEEIRETAESTKECFGGRSGELFRKRMEKRNREEEDTVLELSMLSARLQEIADEYASAERENRDVAGGN